jgi:hypothetical protein
MRTDVAELGERPEQLPPLECRLRGEHAELRNPEERIGQRILQRRAECQVLRIELIDIDRSVGGAANRQPLRAAAQVPD